MPPDSFEGGVQGRKRKKRRKKHLDLEVEVGVAPQKIRMERLY